MNQKVFFFAVILLALLVVLPSASGVVAQGPAPDGRTISYSGRLSNDASQVVSDGVYAFTFALYSDAKDGNLLWSETQTGVTVKGGAFTTSLGSVTPLPKEARISNAWLTVSVRGPGETNFTTLAPRQALNTTILAAPASPAVGPSCPHTHWGETWSGTGVGLHLISSNDTPLWAESSGGWAGVDARNTTGNGVSGSSTSGWGVYGASTSGAGVVGKTSTATGDTTGVWGEVASSSSYARGVVGWATKTTGYNIGVWGQSESSSGTGVVGIANNTSCTGGLFQPACYGVSGSSNKGSGVLGTTDSGVALFGYSSGNGIGLYVENGGTGNLIEAWHGPVFAARQFRVTSTGEVYAAGTFHPSGADMAEMLPATDGLESGDVLAVGQNGDLTRSTQPNQASVVGVYSTKPGFVGGAGDGVDLVGKVPLAVVGIVPVKASVENGAIQPGDLLVASSKPGHAMRAPVNPAPGTVIGKALGTLDSGTGIVDMLIMLR